MFVLYILVYVEFICVFELLFYLVWLGKLAVLKIWEICLVVNKLLGQFIYKLVSNLKEGSCGICKVVFFEEQS